MIEGSSDTFQSVKITPTFFEAWFSKFGYKIYIVTMFLIYESESYQQVIDCTVLKQTWHPIMHTYVLRCLLYGKKHNVTAITINGLVYIIFIYKHANK